MMKKYFSMDKKYDLARRVCTCELFRFVLFFACVLPFYLSFHFKVLFDCVSFLSWSTHWIIYNEYGIWSRDCDTGYQCHLVIIGRYVRRKTKLGLISIKIPKRCGLKVIVLDSFRLNSLYDCFKFANGLEDNERTKHLSTTRLKYMVEILEIKSIFLSFSARPNAFNKSYSILYQT